VSSEDFNIKLHVDDSEAVEKEAQWRERLARLNREVDLFETQVRVASVRGLSAMGATVSFINAIAGYFPHAITPMFQAVGAALTTTIASLHAIAAAYAAGGVTAPLAAIVEGAAIGLSIVSVFEVLKGQLNAQAELNKMAATVRSLGTMTQSWSRFLRGLT